MNRSFSLLAVAIVAILILSHSVPGSAQGDLRAYESYLQSGAALEAKQQIDPAGELYARAVDAAPSRTERVEAWLAWAAMLSRNPGSGEVAQRRTGKAEALYTSALSQAEGDLKLKAHNDFGVFLLRRRQIDKASAVLGEIEKANWPGLEGPGLRARYLYNYGRALEGSQRPAEAYSRYLEAIRLDPEFEPSREAANRLANQPATPGGRPFPDPALPLARSLLAQNRLPEAGSSLRRLAGQPDRLRNEDPEGFVDLLVQYLTSAQVDPEQFDQSWKNSVISLQGALPSPAAERLGEIRDGYSAPLEVDFHPGAATARFKAWSDAERARPFSNFLKMVGDAYASRGNLRSSLARYSQAVSLDPSNSAAGLFLTNLLVEYSGQLDPQGALLHQWREQSDDMEEQAHTPADLKHYVHLQSLLGMHFEKESPQTAVTHWQRAVQAQERIAAAEPSRPALYEHLGMAYEALGQRGEAAREYRAAAMAYRSQGDSGKDSELSGRVAELERGDPDLRVAMVTDQTMRTTGATIGDSDTDATATTGTGATTNTTGTMTMASTGSYEENADSLPSTASSWPATGLLGVLFLAMSLVVHRWRRR